MPSTTVHIPDKLLAELDNAVKHKGISRNRFIMEACKIALENDAGQWPGDFFETDLGEEDLNLLREGADEMITAIGRMRRNRSDTQI